MCINSQTVYCQAEYISSMNKKWHRAQRWLRESSTWLMQMQHQETQRHLFNQNVFTSS